MTARSESIRGERRRCDRKKRRAINEYAHLGRRRGHRDSPPARSAAPPTEVADWTAARARPSAPPPPRAQSGRRRRPC